jgi:CRP/FNR family cyclic AMP-dependent transcriptional regulator
MAGRSDDKPQNDKPGSNEPVVAATGAGGAGAAEAEQADRARLAAKFGRPFIAGEALFREGEPAKEAFLLQEGRVRLLKRVRTVERSLMVLRPGDLFGESALLQAPARNSTAVALTDGVALALQRDTFRALLEAHPSIAMRVIEQLTVRVRDAEDQIEIMMLRDTQSKVVSALLKLARDFAATGGAGDAAAELQVTPVELSTRVGLDVDTVKRAVQRLREQGYVKITGEKVEIPELGALRKLYTLLGTKEDLRGEAMTFARVR